MSYAETKLSKKSGDTRKVVWFIRGSRQRFFWDKIVKDCWQVFKYCWEMEPNFNVDPVSGRKETIFQRNMRIYRDRGGTIPKVHAPTSKQAEIYGSGDDDIVPSKDLTRFAGHDTIICRPYATFWVMVTYARMTKTGSV